MQKAGIWWGVLTLVEGARYETCKLRAFIIQCKKDGSAHLSARSQEETSHPGNILEEAEVMLSAHAINIHVQANQSFVISMSLRPWGS